MVSHLFTNIFSFLPRPFQSLQEKKKKHVQTDKMSNIGRRKCKYFGAASFSFLVFLFIFFETLELLNFSAPSFSFLSASVQMPSLCALCSRLSFWILLFSHQTTYWGKKKKTDRQEQEGGREKKERKCIHSSVLVSSMHMHSHKAVA